jgi:hypothetical protein
LSSHLPCEYDGLGVAILLIVSSSIAILSEKDLHVLGGNVEGVQQSAQHIPDAVGGRITAFGVTPQL